MVCLEMSARALAAFFFSVSKRLASSTAASSADEARDWRRRVDVVGAGYECSSVRGALSDCLNTVMKA